MKIAVFTDIHGNYPALKAIMEDINKYKFDVTTYNIKAPVKKNDIVGILEIKTAQNKKSKWYYEDGSKGVPEAYLDQAVHYFNTTNAEFVIFYCLINYDRDDIDRDMEFLKPRRINRDDVKEYMQEVQAECVDFRENYVKKGECPKNRIVF